MRSLAGVAFVCAVLGAGCAIVPGCGRSTTPSPAEDAPKARGGPPRLLDLSELTEAEKKYGISAERTPSVVYQPEVVLLPAGARAIRSLSADGLVWTLDPDAEGAGDIQPGKVLLLTTRAAGRVLDVRRTSAGLQVVLGPAEITDIIREGTFSLSQPVDLSQALQMSTPESFDLVRPVAPLVAQRAWPDGGGFFLRPASFATASAPAQKHGFRVIPMASVKGVGAELRSNEGGALMVGQIRLLLQSPELNFHLEVKPGRVVSAMVELKGATGIEVSFEAAAPNPRAANINEDRQAPVDLSIPINGMGIPFALHVRQAFRVQTAFTSTGTLKAHGRYTVGGAIRGEYRNGTFEVSAPGGFGAQETLLPSIEGVAFGPTGLVLTHSIKVIVGVGVAGFVAGPFVTNNSSVTAARASDLGIVGCRRETVAMAVAAGVGYQIPPAVAAFINTILEGLNISARVADSGGISTDPKMVVNTGWYQGKTCK